MDKCNRYGAVSDLAFYFEIKCDLVWPTHQYTGSYTERLMCDAFN